MGSAVIALIGDNGSVIGARVGVNKMQKRNTARRSIHE